MGEMAVFPAKERKWREIRVSIVVFADCYCVPPCQKGLPAIQSLLRPGPCASFRRQLSIIDKVATFMDLAYPKHVSKEAINRLPLKRYHGVIHLVREDSEVPEALAALEKESVLGFDTESRPSFQKGVSYPPTILQFAAEKAVYLFQLRHLEGLGLFAPLLGNAAVLKVGVALHEDLRRLKAVEDFDEAGFIELGDISQRLGIVNTGLRALAAIFLGCRISKGAQVSNWNKPDLTEAQITYAATDAWACREIYYAMQAKGLLEAGESPDQQAAG